MKRLFSIVLLFMSILSPISESAEPESFITEKLIFEHQGKDLVGVLSRPEVVQGQKIPLVILMHGLAATKEYPIIKDTADALKNKGIATLLFDFSGHGESGGRDVDMTVPQQIEEAKIFAQYALQLDWVSSVTLLGHSQGGLVAGYVAAEFGAEYIPYLVLLSPASVLIDFAQTGTLSGQYFFDPHNIPNTFPLNSYFTISKSYITTMSDLPPVYKTAKSYRGKVLLFEGSADVVVPPSYVKKYADSYPYCTFEFLDGDNHSFSVYHQQVIDKIVNFVLQK